MTRKENEAALRAWLAKQEKEKPKKKGKTTYKGESQYINYNVMY